MLQYAEAVQQQFNQGAIYVNEATTQENQGEGRTTKLVMGESSFVYGPD